MRENKTYRDENNEEELGINRIKIRKEKEEADERKMEKEGKAFFNSREGNENYFYKIILRECVCVCVCVCVGR